MVIFNQVSLRRGSKLLFDQASFRIHPGQKLGIIGANGSGKSSLFALLRGELQPDQGELSIPGEWVMAHVAQETPAVDTPAIDYVMDGDVELRRVQAELALAEQQNDGLRLASLHARIEAIDGYQARSRAARLLSGLGFGKGQENAPVRSFSGGWRMRLNLAQALMCRSDLLLLDEPTNHLDLEAVIWLETWLRSYGGTLLLISHDRDFLDHTIDHVAHMERQQITLHRGHYSAFEQRRAEQLAQQQAAHDKQQREIAHFRRYVDRFRAKASKARQAQSRLKALERMELITAAHVDSPFHFDFAKPDKLPHPLLSLDDVTVAYGNKVILKDISLSLVPGDRIGLLGPNGAGKSTLIKLLAGKLEPTTGRLEVSPELRIGYFAQHQLEQLRGDETALQHLQALDKHASEQRLRDFLGGFGFQGERVEEPVAPFSGGEKARLVLAMLAFQQPNLLLMDEPTNHLDLEMRHALTLALQAYEGALLLVSHDRNLLATVTDRLLLVDHAGVKEFDGDMNDYGAWLAQRRIMEKPPQKTEPGSTVRKNQRRQEAEQRKKIQPLRKELQKIEKRLDKLNHDRTELEHQLADTRLYQESEKDRLKQLLSQQAELTKALSETESVWLELSEQMELNS